MYPKVISSYTYIPLLRHLPISHIINSSSPCRFVFWVHYSCSRPKDSACLSHTEDSFVVRLSSGRRLAHTRYLWPVLIKESAKGPSRERNQSISSIIVTFGLSLRNRTGTVSFSSWTLPESTSRPTRDARPRHKRRRQQQQQQQQQQHNKNVNNTSPTFTCAHSSSSLSRIALRQLGTIFSKTHYQSIVVVAHETPIARRL